MAGRSPHPSARTCNTDSRIKTLFCLLRETAAAWMHDRVMRLSAALAFYTILSLAPLLVMTIRIVGITGGSNKFARRNVTDQISNLAGTQAANAVQSIIQSNPTHHGGSIATVIGAIVLLFSATGVFMELQDSMNVIWGVKLKPNQNVRNFIRNRLLSLGMVLGVGFLLVLSSLIGWIASGLGNPAGPAATFRELLANIALPYVVVTVLFTAIFKFLPDVQVPWKRAGLGGVVAALLFMVGRWGLALYFKHASNLADYGAAGSLVVVLSWVYYSSFILFFGAEVTKVWTYHFDGPPRASAKHVEVRGFHHD